MRIAVVGGTGRVGTALLPLLRHRHVEVVSIARSTGVDTRTGEGLADALAGASVVVDVTDPRAVADDVALDFFEASTRHLLAAGAAAGAGHHVVLSVVGADRLTDGGYFRAKVAQERLVADGPLPATVVRATQFFEFVGTIAAAATTGDTVRVPPALIRPVAVADVAAVLASVAVAPPSHGVVEVAGPEVLRLDDALRRWLDHRGDQRRVVVDPDSRYFGASLCEGSLLPAADAALAPTRLDDWLASAR